MADEEVLLEEVGIRVTTTRVTLGSTTYPVNGITSVRVGSESPSLFPLVMLSTLGCVLGPVIGFVPGLGQQGGPNPVASIAGGVVMFGLVGLGIVMQLRGKSRYYVVLGTGAGERRALYTRDKDTAHRTRESIEQAVTRRG